MRGFTFFLALLNARLTASLLDGLVYPTFSSSAHRKLRIVENYHPLKSDTDRRSRGTVVPCATSGEEEGRDSGEPNKRKQRLDARRAGKARGAKQKGDRAGKSRAKEKVGKPKPPSSSASLSKRKRKAANSMSMRNVDFDSAYGLSGPADPAEPELAPSELSAAEERSANAPTIHGKAEESLSLFKQAFKKDTKAQSSAPAFLRLIDEYYGEGAPASPSELGYTIVSGLGVLHREEVQVVESGGEEEIKLTGHVPCLPAGAYKEKARAELTRRVSGLIESRRREIAAGGGSAVATSDSLRMIRAYLRSELTGLAQAAFDEELGRKELADVETASSVILALASLATAYLNRDNFDEVRT